jgi:hypothetical protein
MKRIGFSGEADEEELMQAGQLNRNTCVLSTGFHWILHHSADV